MNKVNRPQMSESFVLGSILAVTGGFLDAYTYISRGKVLANAQTGNIVLLGINLAEGMVKQAVPYLFPILAFIFGVLLTEWVRSSFYDSKEKLIHWRQMIVIIEIIILAFVGLIPQGKWDFAANILVSFVCAMQVEAFRKVSGNAFATTMCTGNLRSATDLLFQHWTKKDSSAGKKSLIYYTIILFFIGGVILGSVLTRCLEGKSVFVCCFLLIPALAAMFRK